MPEILAHPNDNYTQPFKGWIGEFRLWNYARSPEQISSSKAALTGSTEGLVAWYDMIDDAQTIVDMSPKGNTAKLGSAYDIDTNDPTWLGRCEIDCSIENNFRKGISNDLEKVNNDLIIQPNPTTNTASISHKESIKEAKLINLLGIEVEYQNYTDSQETVILGHSIPPGLYQLEILTDSGEKINGKLIKH